VIIRFAHSENSSTFLGAGSLAQTAASRDSSVAIQGCLQTLNFHSRALQNGLFLNANNSWFKTVSKLFLLFEPVFPRRSVHCRPRNHPTTLTTRANAPPQA
jgi:hypothetical protein